jgi:hypothetical protein
MRYVVSTSCRGVISVSCIVSLTRFEPRASSQWYVSRSLALKGFPGELLTPAALMFAMMYG